MCFPKPSGLAGTMQTTAVSTLSAELTTAWHGFGRDLLCRGGATSRHLDICSCFHKLASNRFLKPASIPRQLFSVVASRIRLGPAFDIGELQVFLRVAYW